MSASSYTFKKSIKGYALKDGAIESEMQPECVGCPISYFAKWKKGDEIPIQVYESHTSSRGGGSSTITIYLYDKPHIKNRGRFSGLLNSLRLGKDFTLDMSDTSKGLDNNKKNMYLLLLAVSVVGYLAYKKFKK